MSNEQEMREAFEKWWRVAVVSDVTGEVDHALWPNIDKDDSLCIWQAATLAAEARIRDAELRVEEDMVTPSGYAVGFYNLITGELKPMFSLLEGNEEDWVNVYYISNRA